MNHQNDLRFRPRKENTRFLRNKEEASSSIL